MSDPVKKGQKHQNREAFKAHRNLKRAVRDVNKEDALKNRACQGVCRRCAQKVRRGALRMGKHAPLPMARNRPPRINRSKRRRRKYDTAGVGVPTPVPLCLVLRASRAASDPDSPRPAFRRRFVSLRSPQVVWRFNFGKYKALKPGLKGNCKACREKLVHLAYRNLCDGCAKETKLCPGCSKPPHLAELAPGDGAPEDADEEGGDDDSTDDATARGFASTARSTSCPSRPRRSTSSVKPAKPPALISASMFTSSSI